MAIITETNWRILVRRTRQGKLLPIIGDQVTSQLLFDNHKLIRAWCEDIGYPLGQSFNITRLAQFLSVEANDDLAAKEEFLAFLKRYYVASAREESGDHDGAAALDGNLHALRLSELVGRIDQAILDDEVVNPLRRLAQLPVEIYITTSYHNFMEQTLRSVGKEPRVEICYWDHHLKASATGAMAINPLVRVRDVLVQSFSEGELRELAFELNIEYSDLPGDRLSAKARELAAFLKRHNRLSDLAAIGRQRRPDVAWSGLFSRGDRFSEPASAKRGLPSVFELDPNYYPTSDEPLVYHLLGLDAYPASMVLTEDDYLDFLVSISADRRIIPGRVKQALSDSSLVLLGYELLGWDFRVLFRGLITRKRSARRTLSLAIQLAPATDEAGQPTEMTGAQSYLERYFYKANFDIYWGSPQEFVQDLWRRWKKTV
ncbi:MAG: SIR2 family protein [Chloroflexota bacterium]|nr:MAG: SIR2 family protein [Chloroflexota bacterium]